MLVKKKMPDGRMYRPSFLCASSGGVLKRVLREAFRRRSSQRKVRLAVGGSDRRIASTQGGSCILSGWQTKLRTTRRVQCVRCLQ